MASRPNGALRISVTSNLARREWEHREGATESFTNCYSLKCLVHAKPHETITAAIQRGHTLEHWPRTWKVQLIILERNPGWAGLYALLT